MLRSVIVRRSVFALAVGAMGLLAEAEILDPIPAPIVAGDISVRLSVIADGLVAPNLLTHANDGSGRRYVVDQAGQVRVIASDGALLATPLLDVSDVLSGLNGAFDNSSLPEDLGLNSFFDERGLLGLAFHPGFADASSPGYRRLYTYTSEPVTQAADFSTLLVSESPNHQSVVAQWRVSESNPLVVDPASRRELFRVDQPQFNHNSGMLAFDPTSDNPYLYITIGDGGNADDVGDGHVPGGNGQDPSSVLGSIMRIDPLGTNSSNGRYGIPVDNPFAGDDGVADEIFAYGLRNAFRFSFDRVDGRLVVADVGQNKIEEINIVAAGDNLGWPIKEGTFFFDQATGEISTTPFPGQVDPGDLVDPVAQYDHDEGISVIGGFVYRGSEIPELFGKYVFGDFGTSFVSPSGRLFYADLDTGLIQELGIEGADDLGLYIKGFGEDEAGEIYLLAGTNLGPVGADGLVLRLGQVPEPGSGAALLLAGVVMAHRLRRVVLRTQSSKEVSHE